MAQKKHKPEEIVAKLRQVDVLVLQGQSVAEAVRPVTEEELRVACTIAARNERDDKRLQSPSRMKGIARL